MVLSIGDIAVGVGVCESDCCASIAGDGYGVEIAVLARVEMGLKAGEDCISIAMSLSEFFPAASFRSTMQSSR